MLDGLVGGITRHRTAIVVALVAITVGLGSQIPRIQADPAPESLLASFKEQERAIIERFERTFGDTERVMVILVEAPKVLDAAPLQYVHDLTRGLADMAWVEQTQSLTNLPLPRRAPDAGAGAPAESLDDLDQGESLDDLDQGESLDDLDALEAEGGGESGGQEDQVLDALLTIIEADPERFPGGLSELGPRLQEEIRTDAIIVGERVTPEAAAELQRAVEQSPLIVGRLVSDDGTVAAIALHLRPIESRAMYAAMEELRAYLDAHAPPSGVTVHIGGLPYLRSEMVSKMRADQLVLIPFTLLVFLGLLYASFRWLPGMLLPIAAVTMPVLMVVGGMAIAGQPMNVLNNVIPSLLIIIGVSDSIHIVGRYLEESTRTSSRLEAGRRTLRVMMVACLLTSATTAVGLASNVVSTTVMLRSFGIIAGVGVMVSYTSKILFLPSVLTWVKPRPTESSQGGWLDVAIMTMTARILDHPWKVLSATAIFIGLCVFGASNLRRDHALLDQFDERDDVYQTTRLLEDKFEGVRPLELYLRSSEAGRFQDPELIAAVERVEAWAEARPEIIRTMAPWSFMRELYVLVTDDPTVRTEPFHSAGVVAAIGKLLSMREPSPLAAWMTADGREARVRFSVRDVGSSATLELIDELKAKLDAELGAYPDVQASFLGEAYNGSRGQAAVVTDLTSSLGTAVTVIFVMLVLLFRSLRLALLSIPPYMVPLLGTAAYMTLRDIPLNTGNVIIFSISIGMAVDGTIHVLERFRQESERGLRSNAALLRAARGTGRSIVIACLTLSAGFSVFLFSAFVPIRRFGELIAVTMMMCILATLIVQPALLKVFGTSRKMRKAQRAEDERIAAAVRARSGTIEDRTDAVEGQPNG